MRQECHCESEDHSSAMLRYSASLPASSSLLLLAADRTRELSTLSSNAACCGASSAFVLRSLRQHLSSQHMRASALAIALPLGMSPVAVHAKSAAPIGTTSSSSSSYTPRE